MSAVEMDISSIYFLLQILQLMHQKGEFKDPRFLKHTLIRKNKILNVQIYCYVHTTSNRTQQNIQN